MNRVVYPVWDHQIHPRLEAVDSYYGLSKVIRPYVDTVSLHWFEFDEKYRVSYTLDTLLAKAKLWAATTGADGFENAKSHTCYWLAMCQLYYGEKKPLIDYYVESYRSLACRTTRKVLAHVRVHSSLIVRSSVKHIQRYYKIYFEPRLRHVIEVIYAHEHTQTVLSLPQVQWLVNKAHNLASVVRSTQIPNAVQQKTDFLRDEFFNLINNAGHKLDTDEDSGEVLTKDESADALSLLESSDSDEEVLTFTSTLTRTVTQGGTSVASEQKSDVPSHHELAVPVAPEDEEVAEYGVDSSQKQIEHEIEYWRLKIEKMIEMSYDSLDTDMRPYLQSKIQELKERISANFTIIQQDNYIRYKEMANLTKSIDRDSEFIRTTGEIIESPEVDRQLMRDKISESRDAVKSSMEYVEEALNAAHGPIVEEYFVVAQTTIDVLESFAETAFLDFSARLSGLLTILEGNSDFSGELGWQAWKKFHKIKEEVFTTRDKILDDAHLYKAEPNSANTPQGLQEWSDYLNNVKFHIRFLLSDNDDYLKLVRAKANVAYQMREALTREALTKQAEKKEAEQKEAERREAEKREAEKREVEKREAERREAERREVENREAEKRGAEKREANKIEGEKNSKEDNETERVGDASDFGAKGSELIVDKQAAHCSDTDLDEKIVTHFASDNHTPEATSITSSLQSDLSAAEVAVQNAGEAIIASQITASENLGPIEADESMEAGEADEAEEETPQFIEEVL